jgi:hypothetical protein
MKNSNKMKNLMKAVIFSLMGILSVMELYGQNSPQQLVVPLSDPAKPGTLELNLQNGTIKVTGYTGKDVIINISTDQKKYDEGEDTRDGLKRIPNNSIGITAREESNMVKVNSDNWNKSVFLDIQVPKNFNLKLRDINDGNITVENVSGNMDISHVNGGISLIDISGTAVVNTTNGDVKVSFVKVTPDTPMAFSSFNGNVDVTFPSDTKATVKMKSDHGEIYTDFDMNLSKTPPKVENKQESGEYKISMEEWVNGTINSGGPLISFKTFNGDILVRKRKL